MRNLGRLKEMTALCNSFSKYITRLVAEMHVPSPFSGSSSSETRERISFGDQEDISPLEMVVYQNY